MDAQDQRPATDRRIGPLETNARVLAAGELTALRVRQKNEQRDVLARLSATIGAAVEKDAAALAASSDAAAKKAARKAQRGKK